MMSRPLAAAGFGALAAILISVYYLPSAAAVPLAVLLLVAAAVVFLARKRDKKKSAAAVLLLLTVGFALLRLVAQQQTVERLQRLIDESYHTVEGAVYDRYDGLYENVYTVELRVTRLDGVECRPFTVVCSNAERGEIGQVLRLRIKFEEHNKAYRMSWYAKGIYLRALQEQAGREEILGEGKGVMLSMARLRNRLGGRFMLLGRSTGGTAAAMVVGDRNRTDANIRSQFQQAGVSHILVVSGLHLSLVAAAVTAVCRRLFRRSGVVALCVALGVLAYMLLVGMTVSVVRAGVLTLLALAAPLLDRTADSYNSLGVALLLLLAFNPYAACDLGLLLSFAATLGVLCFGALDARHFRLAKIPFVGGILKNLGVALFAMLFTLPVLAWNGTTVSVGTLAANLLCVPLVFPVIVIGVLFLVTHLLTGSPQLLLTGRVLYFLLRLMEEIVRWVNRIFSHRLGVSGGIAVLVLCAAGAVIWICYHSRLRRWCALVGTAAFLLLCSVNIALNVGTIKIALVGGGINPPVIISQDRECVVLYRGARNNLEAVEDYILLNNLNCPQLVAQLSDNGTQETVRAVLGRLDVLVPEQPSYVSNVDCLDGVHLLFVKQKTGTLCYIEVNGYTVGVSAGPVDCPDYPACNAFLVGWSVPEGLRTDLLIRGAVEPDWLSVYPTTTVYTGEEPVLWLRPGRAWRVLNAEKA